MLIGYARTSTLDQEAGFAAQLAELKAAGCERVYSEQLSSLTDRPQLEAMLNYIRTGDVAYVTSIDRLARDMADLLNIQARIAKAGATLRIRGLVDTADASGELVLHVFSAVAAFEVRRMKERQRIGIERAKAQGKFKGRVPTAQRQSARVLELKAAGRKPAEIVREVGISRSSVWRILAGGAAQANGGI